MECSAGSSHQQWHLSLTTSFAVSDCCLPKDPQGAWPKVKETTLPFCKKKTQLLVPVLVCGICIYFGLQHMAQRLEDDDCYPELWIWSMSFIKKHGHFSTPHVAIPKSRHGSAWCPSTSGTINQLFVAHIPTSLSSGAVWTLRDGYFFSPPGPTSSMKAPRFRKIQDIPVRPAGPCLAAPGPETTQFHPIPIFIPHRFRIFCWELFDESHPLWDSWNIEHHCVVFLMFYLKSTTESCTVMSFGL